MSEGTLQIKPLAHTPKLVVTKGYLLLRWTALAHDVDDDAIQIYTFHGVGRGSEDVGIGAELLNGRDDFGVLALADLLVGLRLRRTFGGYCGQGNEEKDCEDVLHV